MFITNPLKESPLIKYNPIATAMCSIGKAPFSCILHISYVPGSFLLDFQEFEHWIYRDIGVREITIEELAEAVYLKLRDGLIDAVALRLECVASTPVHSPVTVIYENV